MTNTNTNTNTNDRIKKIEELWEAAPYPTEKHAACLCIEKNGDESIRTYTGNGSDTDVEVLFSIPPTWREWFSDADMCWRRENDEVYRTEEHFDGASTVPLTEKEQENSYRDVLKDFLLEKLRTC